MDLSVFGLGYVGCVSAGCFAREGHSVVGVDVNPAKVEMINCGESTIVEEGIAELIREVVEQGRLRATTDVADAVVNSSLSLICVGTPSNANGSINLEYIERVCEQIGTTLREKQAEHLIVIRSTVLPGTIDGVVIPALERASGKRVGEGFDVCSNPEFLREGSSIRDFYDPPFTLIGATSVSAAERLAELYVTLEAPVQVVEIRAAEMVKYACNSFHGLKVSFANEIGNICKAMGIDSHEVMRVFCADTKLNISPVYLKPGFAFGGSCLPKDLRAISYRARQEDVETPVLNATLESNRLQIEKAVDMVLQTGNRRVGVLGLSFKEGTDDLRESPMVALVEQLIGKGMQLKIYDRNVSQAALLGANREFIEGQIPHIWNLMQDSIQDVVEDAETLVLGNRDEEFREVVSGNEEQVVIDLARVVDGKLSSGRGYQGICW
ncbi:nucleotide sugar dehydrogenase [soil metagenome]